MSSLPAQCQWVPVNAAYLYVYEGRLHIKQTHNFPELSHPTSHWMNLQTDPLYIQVHQLFVYTWTIFGGQLHIKMHM